MELDQEDLTKELGLEESQNDNQEQPKIEEPSNKLKIGNDEYTQDQINELVGYAKQVKETEKRYNTRFDSVWPAYGKSQDRVKQLERELEEVKKPKTELPADQEYQMQQAKKVLKEMGVLTKDDLTEFENVIREKARDEYRLQSATDKILNEAGRMEKEIDGSDGRPVFRKEEILQYMNDTGIQDMGLAYKVKYEKELDSWKESKLREAKKPGIQTMDKDTRSTARQPESPKVTRDNLNDMLAEALEGKL